MDKPRIKLSDCQVFFDFDNTITPFDVLDDIVQRFSVNKDWVRLEKLWKQGKIGSKECLQGQMRLLRLDKKGLLKYLSQIKIDPYFKKLLALLKKEGIKPIILSDNFSFIINNILKNNKVGRIKVYSNELEFCKDSFLTSFPHRDKACFICAHCKKTNLLKHIKNDKIKIYIGDGLSDICPAKNVDLVFAKKSLLKFCRKNKLNHIECKSLKDVYKYFKGN